MRTLIFDISDTNFQKLKLVADHLGKTENTSVQVDAVAAQLLGLILDNGEWSLENVNLKLEADNATNR